MVRFFILLSLFVSLYGEQVEIVSDSFEANENSKVSYFRGNVHIIKGRDKIDADLIKITFDSNNKPIKYEATGNINFEIYTNNQHFKGSSNKIIYNPKDKTYKAQGNVKINELLKGQLLRGESISINRKTGQTSIRGNRKRPVKFIFTVDE